MLVVGAGRSGVQIAEELHRAGREVHLAVSRCSAAPRRYRGRDLAWWLLQVFRHGAEVGVVAKLPSPAARSCPAWAAAGIDAPPDDRPPPGDSSVPATGTELAGTEIGS